MKKKMFIGLLVVATIASAYYLKTHDNTASPSNVVEQHDTTDPEVITDQKPTEINKKLYSSDAADSIWVVANKKRPLNPLNYAPPDLIAVGGGQQLRKEPGEALQKLIATAKTEGLTISPLSGYRSYNTQVSVYGNEVKSYGQAVADTQSARPGHSEHQTGLAIDVGGGGCGIEDCFGQTAEGNWVASNAYKYGFIIRYVQGKESITGYRAEPWHLRYVGTELASEMQKQGAQTLEEFFGLPAAPGY